MTNYIVFILLLNDGFLLSCSCLIARNLLSGLRTCVEVSDYMNDDGAAVPRGPAYLTNSSPDDNGKLSMDHTVCSHHFCFSTSAVVFYCRQIFQIRPRT